MRLCGISSHFWLLSPGIRQVTHALLTRPPLEIIQICRSFNKVFPVRLACVKHAASVHPEPGSNSLIKCLMHSRHPTSLVISRHYCLISFHSKMNCIKKFSRIVCVSLFSYQGCFAVSSLRQLVYFIISSRSCQALFSKVFEVFQIVSKVVCFCRSVQATWLLYHKFSRLSIVNLNFLKTILFFSISEAIPCDSFFTIPLPQGIVKHFFIKNPYFFV